MPKPGFWERYRPIRKAKTYLPFESSEREKLFKRGGIFDKIDAAAKEKNSEIREKTFIWLDQRLSATMRELKEQESEKLVYDVAERARKAVRVRLQKIMEVFVSELVDKSPAEMKSIFLSKRKKLGEIQSELLKTSGRLTKNPKDRGLEANVALLHAYYLRQYEKLHLAEYTISISGRIKTMGHKELREEYDVLDAGMRDLNKLIGEDIAINGKGLKKHKGNIVRLKRRILDFFVKKYGW